MRPSSSFTDIPTAARMPAETLASKLAEIDPDAETVVAKGLWNPFTGEPRIWQSNAHAFGFISDNASEGNLKAIVDIGAISADKSLINTRLNVTLNYLRVAEHPGKGTHRVLFDFYAKN